MAAKRGLLLLVVAEITSTPSNNTMGKNRTHMIGDAVILGNWKLKQSYSESFALLEYRLISNKEG